MKKILLFIWQLPQHLAGLVLIAVLKAVRELWIWNGERYIYWTYQRKGRLSNFISGASLGQYIILPPLSMSNLYLTVRHEYGHSKQSLIFGPLYLLAIGIPSAVFNNLWDRWFHKNWPTEKRHKWYYNRYPEKWADKLGGVNR